MLRFTFLTATALSMTCTAVAQETATPPANANKPVLQEPATPVPNEPEAVSPPVADQPAALQEQQKSPSVRPLFDAQDKNTDGYIDKQELLAAAEERFTKIDTNNDGKISPEEVGAHMQQTHQARQNHTPAPIAEQPAESAPTTAAPPVEQNTQDILPPEDATPLTPPDVKPLPAPAAPVQEPVAPPTP